MDDKHSQDEALRPEQKKVIFIIWGALAVSMLIYGLVLALTLQGKGNTSLKPQEIMTYRIIFGALSFSNLVIIFIVAPRFFSASAYLVYCILRWALGEAIAIFGFILGILEQNLMAFVPFLVVALMAHLINMPNQRDLEGFKRFKQRFGQKPS